MIRCCDRCGRPYTMGPEDCCVCPTCDALVCEGCDCSPCECGSWNEDEEPDPNPYLCFDRQVLLNTFDDVE
jgi:hypothetical protein